MSGHSKWATTKRQKSVIDAKRGNLFTKLSNNIAIAARHGGSDSDMNFRLRIAIDKAKQANMPKDNIERAVKRGAGELEGQQIEEVIYEGFGPEKLGVIIEAITDNKNRTVGDLKHIFTKFGGSLAANGSVIWMFEHLGVISCTLTVPLTEEQELALIDLGATNWETNEDFLIIYVPATELQAATEKLGKVGFTVASSELAYLPKEKKEVANTEAWKKFLEGLEEHDDVSNYYTNAKN